MDMIVGPKHFEDMLKDTCYCGAICGRVANRIAKGRFSIDGDSHSVAVNNGPNHLHGGVQGFDSKIWQVQEATRNTLVLTLHSADGEENYPGNLEVVATYTVVEETLHLRLEAYADAATIVNLTNHAYWNLSGKPTIDSMTLEVRASAYTPVDATNIPDGRILPWKERTLTCGRQPCWENATPPPIRTPPPDWTTTTCWIPNPATKSPPSFWTRNPATA